MEIIIKSFEGGVEVLQVLLSNSLIIYQVRTKELNHNREGSSLKRLYFASYFQLSSRCLDNPMMKHGLSCLIYYFYDSPSPSMVKILNEFRYSAPTNITSK